MIFQGDVIISEIIKQGLDDMRNNLWLIDDVLSDFVTEEALKTKYGQKEIDRAKEWFKNNKVDVYMRYRVDKDQLPCVTIALGNSEEKEGMKTLGDLSTEVVDLVPSKIGKPLPFIVKPFAPESFDLDTLTFTVPSSVQLRGVVPGMLLIDVDNGNGYVIESVSGQEFTIVALKEEEEVTGTKFGIVPKYQFYRARREHTFFQESYQIGCHVHGDPAPLLWLHSIVLYILLRYREAALEGHKAARSR